MMRNEMFADMAVVIDQVIALEAKSRERSFVDDAQGVEHFANQAYSIFMDVPMKLMPTVVMGLADSVNRERELIRALREDLRDGASALRSGLQGLANDSEVGSYTLGELMTSLATFDEIIARLEGYGAHHEPDDSES